MRSVPFAAAVLVFALAACGGSSDGVQTYTDPERLSLVELPSDWHLYPQEQVSNLDGFPFMASYGNTSMSVRSVVAFDGAPAAAVDNLTVDPALSSYPIGSASVRDVSESTKEILSRFLLTQSVLDYTDDVNVQEVTKEDFSFGSGFDGVRRLVAYTTADGTGQGVAYLISVTDSTDDRVFAVVAGCNLECFTENQAEIERVVDSWLVNTKG